uniref:NR LBD domain-containing protein n=1 Tax=Steinernema glaseri TaxID=37863 RepID=A0A1I7Y5B1_9BILA
NINNLFIGGSNCVFLQSINASAQDSSAPWTRAERTQLLDFISSLSVFLDDGSISDYAKMQMCVHSFSQLLLTSSYLEARMCILIEFGGGFNFGFFGDFLACFSF